MHQFQLVWKKLININTPLAKTIGLFKELCKSRPAFMIYKSFRNQSDPETLLNHSDTKFNIVRPTGYFKTSRLFIHLSRQPHIETPRMKLSDVLFVTTNPSRGKRTRHGVGNRFLNRRKGMMCRIRSAKSIPI